MILITNRKEGMGKFVLAVWEKAKRRQAVATTLKGGFVGINRQNLSPEVFALIRHLCLAGFCWGK
jgi:hypothetical protein